jgi:outer membrane protein assembly factor BamE (lipoprotein component of BamABCDE complex)
VYSNDVHHSNYSHKNLRAGMLSSGAFFQVFISAAIIHCNGAPTVYTITSQQYATIQIGWTRDQVTKLVGNTGNVVSQSGAGISSVIILQYTGVGISTAVANFGFVGGQLVSKSAVGLESSVSNKVTLQQYKTIQIGWTQQQVTQLLGGSGNIVSQAGVPGSVYQSIIVQYSGAQSDASIATFNFVGGFLLSKAHTGLDTGVYTITSQQYTTIQIGWTRDQVTGLVSSAGDVVSEAGTGHSAVVIVQYKASGTSYGIASFGFIAGKLSSMSKVGFR